MVPHRRAIRTGSETERVGLCGGHLVTPECRNRPTRISLQRLSAGAPHRNHLSTCHLMVSSAPDAASPCSVCELCDTADEAEQHHAMEDDGAASASLVRCLTLPWFSHSAGDVLQNAMDIPGAAPETTESVRITNSGDCAAGHAGWALASPVWTLHAVHGQVSPRVTKRSSRRGVMLCSLSMVECVDPRVCIR